MAYSSSVLRAQAIKHCELCQDDCIKWRCIDCDMCLCEKCKISHLKIPVTSQHQIVTIGTPLKGVQKKIVTDNIPCHKHPKKMSCMYCRSCDSLICPDCVSSSHKKHNFVPIDSVLGEKLDNLRGIQQRIVTDLKHCEFKISEVQTIKPTYNALFDESLTNIKQKEQELIDSIKKYSKDLQEKVEYERSKVNNILSKVKQDVDTTKKNLDEQKDEIDAILASNQGRIIFKAAMEIKNPKFDSLPNQVAQFIPETESKKKTQELFGSVQKQSIPTTNAPPKMQFEVIRTFTTDLPCIDTLATLDEKSAWISCYKRQVARKVNIQGNNITTSQEVSLVVIDMAVTSNHEIPLSVFKNSDIKLLKISGKLVSFLTVAPLFPCGIHVTKDNDVIVGVKEPGNPYTPTDQSERFLIVYGMDGKQKQRYQYEKDGKRLFTNPYRITMNNNKDIVLVDRTSGHTGRVVVLNKKGNLRWLYDGHPQINASEQFDPRAIVTTDNGHIIVSDISSQALHVLSGDGEVLTCKAMRDTPGIEWPWALDIDIGGRLWLGCDQEDYTIDDAKLHIIKLIF